MADKTPLPDRFLMAVRAIRGDFSPADGLTDTERAEDMITGALTTFPATVRLRVVTRPLASASEADRLCEQLNLLLSTLEGAGAPQVDVTDRGSRRSIDLRLRVPNAASLALLRNAINEEACVQMVF